MVEGAEVVDVRQSRVFQRFRRPTVSSLFSQEVLNTSTKPLLTLLPDFLARRPEATEVSDCLACA